MANATKLLILHVPAGGGHKAAARAIAEAAAARHGAGKRALAYVDLGRLAGHCRDRRFDAHVVIDRQQPLGIVTGNRDR